MARNELTDRRYYGKVCELHPEFEGLRHVKNYSCVQCASIKKVAKKKERLERVTAEWNAKNQGQRG